MLHANNPTDSCVIGTRSLRQGSCCGGIGEIAQEPNILRADIPRKRLRLALNYAIISSCLNELAPAAKRSF